MYSALSPYRRAALLVCAAAGILLALAAPAVAQSKRLGPGSFLLGEFSQSRDELTLVLSKDDPTAVKFSGSASVSIDTGSARWTPIAGKAVVTSKGGRLTISGTAGGMTLDDLFPSREPRRLLVRNGDGGTTELDAYRYDATYVYFSAENRQPKQVIPSTYAFASKEIDAREDGEVTVQLPTATALGYDVVLEVPLRDLPERANGRNIQFVATGANGQDTHYGSTYSVSSDLAFVHLTLPRGTYALSAQTNYQFAAPDGAYGSSTGQPVALGSLDVSRSHRIFAIDVPAADLPPLVDANVDLDGLAELAPTFDSPVLVSVSLSAEENSVSASRTLTLTDARPISIALVAPAGEYRASVSAGRSSSDPNGVSTTLSLGLGTRTFPGEAVHVTIPHLVRASGMLYDPDFTLASTPNPITGSTPTHQVYASVTTSDGASASTSATLSGFARNYELLVPEGSTVGLSGYVSISVGRPNAEPNPSANDTVGVSVNTQSQTSVPCAEGCETDLDVPALPAYVTVSGHAVGPDGRPPSHAYVSANLTQADSSLGVSTTVVPDSTGAFTLRLPRAASYQVIVTSY